MRLRSTKLSAISNAVRNLFYGNSLNLNFVGSGSLDPRITFSRTSNATLTGSNGLIQYAPHNLLTYSEQFDNAAWVKVSALVVTPNQIIAPNETLTADLLSKSTTAFQATRQTYTLASTTTVTESVYAKKGNSDYLSFTDDSTCCLTVNLADGSITRNIVFSSVSVVSVGNGWYRISYSRSRSAGTVNALYMWPSDIANTSSFVTNSSTASCYIWGAQLEIGSTATTYNPTTVKNLLGYTEHFDNAAWTKSNAFVQTNLLTYSQEFDNAAWTKFNVSVNANTSVAPDGTATADKIIPVAANVPFKELQQNINITSGLTYTFAGYVKADGYRYAQIVGNSAVFGTFYVNFDLQTGTETAFDAGNSTVVARSITSVGNGWYRISASVTALSTASGRINVDVIPASNSVRGVSWASDGTSGILFWGAQLVQGSVAGDYQVTTAAAAAVQYAGPFGYLSAEKLVENTATSNHEASASSVTVPVGTPVTFSVYAKAGERNFIFVAMFDTQTNAAYFNLSTGAVVSTAGGATAAITAIGNGWYRCSITRTASGNISAYVRTSVTGAATSYTGDGTSGIYIFGAQLSDSASLDPYVYNPVAAPAAAAYYGPRFDYDPVTLAPKGLLIEEQRTNLLTYSEQFDNAVWGKIGCSITANAVTAPDGTTTADKIVSANASTGSMMRATGIASAQTIAFSLYAKAAEWRYVRVQLGASFSPQPAAWFDLQTGTLVSQNGTGASIQSAGNGWYRLTVVSTWVTTIDSSLYIHPSNNSSSYTAGDGTSGIYIWGAQLEAGAFATSYIPTVASQVTRAADNVSMLGSNFSQWYNQNTGTAFIDYATFASGSITLPVMEFSDGTSNNRMLFQNNPAGNSRVLAFVGGSAVVTTLDATAVAQTKVDAAYSVGSWAASYNGAAALTNSYAGVVPNQSQLIIGYTTAGGNPRLNGTIKRITYYNRRLSNSELQSITA